MRRLIGTTTILFLGFALCAHTCNNANIAEEGGLQIAKVIVDENYEVNPSLTPVQIGSMRIDGDVIRLAVAYSGGCKNHDFKLISKNFYMKSLPPQLVLNLEHDDKGDVCRELVQDTLAFDLTPTRFGNHNSVKISVSGGEESALYNYQSQPE